MKGERTGVNALLLGLIALITIVLAPLATLTIMQMMFLPYHHLRITWCHRVLVVADAVLIVVMTYRFFFPRGLRKAPLVLGALSRKLRWGIAMAFCLLLVLALMPVAYWLSFRQGRWAGEPIPSSFNEWTQWMEGALPPYPQSNPDYGATAKGVLFELFPDRLELRDEVIVGKSGVEDTEKEIASRGGNWVPTIKLDHRDLQAADLAGADLRGVSLNEAIMRGAVVEYTQLDNAQLIGVQLQDANLNNAWLRGTDFSNAQLQRASLERAQLQGANLERADLQAADLSNAQLQGANLGCAEDNCVRGPQLQGTHLSHAELQGANLRGAELQGADLSHAELQGANFWRAELQGAEVEGAQLQLADLKDTELQGADLSQADLSDSELDETFVFRTNDATAKLGKTAIRSIHPDQKRLGGNGEIVSLTQKDVDAWIAAAAKFTREPLTAEIAARFARLRQDFQTPDQDARNAEGWRARLELNPDRTGTQYRQRLASFLGDLACATDDSPYVAQRLMYSRLRDLGDQLGSVIELMKAGRKEPNKCQGVARFTERHWRWLEKIEPRAAPADR
jgi:uncharacterized protein YjbI with pentapeptide repeats